MALLTLLAVTTVALAGMRSLFGVVIMTGIYSFLMATLMIALDAVDVAMTEASVGAGISIIVLLGTLHLTKTREAKSVRPHLVSLGLVLVIGAVLVWGSMSLPSFGAADAVIHQHIAPHYLSQSIRETNVPNVVTAVLADYRSFDTLGEATVIFTAGIGVMMLLAGLRRRDPGATGGAKK